MTQPEVCDPDPSAHSESDSARVLRELAAAAAGEDPRRATTVLSHRVDGLVVRHGDTVAKAHAIDTDFPLLVTRVRVAAHPLLRHVLLPPLPAPLLRASDPNRLVDTLGDGRAVTRWPYGDPVDPEAPEAAPWAQTGVLLARLHTTPISQLPGPLPPMGGPTKAARALTRLRECASVRPFGDAVDAVERAWKALPDWARGEAAPPGPWALCHGDWHLGQLVRHPAPGGPWQMIDVDDLGVGPPSWDLGRPAAWYAAGLLTPREWGDFLSGYLSAGGPAIVTEADPWQSLDVPARALTVQTAALAVAKAREGRRVLDEAEQALVDCCARMTP